MGPIMQLIFEILMISLIIYGVYRGWQKADLKDKASRAELVEEEFKTVKKLERTHKGLNEKSNKVSEFKKKDY